MLVVVVDNYGWVLVISLLNLGFVCALAEPGEKFVEQRTPEDVLNKIVEQIKEWKASLRERYS